MPGSWSYAGRQVARCVAGVRPGGGKSWLFGKYSIQLLCRLTSQLVSPVNSFQSKVRLRRSLDGALHVVSGGGVLWRGLKRAVARLWAASFTGAWMGNTAGGPPHRRAMATIFGALFADLRVADGAEQLPCPRILFLELHVGTPAS